MTFLSANTSFPLKRASTASITSDVGQYLLGFEKKWTLAGRYRSCSFLKQHGGLLFQMTMGWSIFTPAAQTKKVTVNRCVDFLPPFACFPFSTNPLFGRALKNSQICPYPNVFQWAFNQSVYPAYPESDRFCRHVSGLANNTTFFYGIGCFPAI